MERERNSNPNQRNYQQQNGYNQGNNYYQQINPYQSNPYQSNMYQQNGYNQQPNYYQGQDYIEMNNIYVWLLVCVPVVSLVMNTICTLIGINSTLTTILTLFINAGLILLDIGEVSMAKANGGWVVWGFLLTPVYLCMRARKTDHKYSYFVAWICSWLGCLFIQLFLLMFLQLLV